MRLLLDTHIVYWYFYDDARLPKGSLEIMQSAQSVYVSSVALWEIAIKVKTGKMQGDPEELVRRMDESGLLELPVNFAHAVEVTRLPLLHGDPFDRMLVAQAVSESLFLITADSQLPQYSNLVIRV
jgi:PIN domain nuclease of toxin-antitoxin system